MRLRSLLLSAASKQKFQPQIGTHPTPIAGTHAKNNLNNDGIRNVEFGQVGAEKFALDVRAAGAEPALFQQLISKQQLQSIYSFRSSARRNAMPQSNPKGVSDNGM